MAHPQHPGRTPRPMGQPQLPAFCRTRRPITTTVRLSSLRQLQWLLWLVLALQLSTVLLVLAGPVPAPLAAAPGGFTPAVFASRHGAPVLSPSQP
ncbi:hypothetical protein [Synechococcus sp. EJ6-Ellesmere]|uniref:hypothetical protein n=1 Tax=Synechococcus sp. EJ6-Ellesmere TaxID=2823734 RepID=UPI0020CBBA12|nr:hypothetical protein [Synechococcus sp. EJ6-Ellesmere]MCP9825443.1 hypothetical protein [Synechococcus sp. EJ6-Ellesmere]